MALKKKWKTKDKNKERVEKNNLSASKRRGKKNKRYRWVKRMIIREQPVFLLPFFLNNFRFSYCQYKHYIHIRKIFGFLLKYNKTLYSPTYENI